MALLNALPTGSSVKTVYNFGEAVNGTYISGIPDGLGAYKTGTNTIRLLVNSEARPTAGFAYKLANGTELAGGRLNFLDINISGSTPTATNTGIAYDTIYDRNGTIVTKASQINGGLTTTAGFNRFCSANFIKANTYGKGTGFKRDLFLIGEESGDYATMQIFDPSTKTLYGAADLGYGGWESGTVLNTGNKNKVAVLLGDDAADAPIYMYVGTKKNKGTVLEQNGLIGGKMYVWAADSGSKTSASLAEKTTTAGTWKEILVKDGTKAGKTGYDALGYKQAATLRAEAKTLGAFLGYRIEDVDANPLNGAQAVFNTTGGQTTGTSGNDYYGSTWTIETTFKKGDPITGQLKHVYDGDATGKGKNGIRSQDNLAWSADGYIYIQEDKATEKTPGDFGAQEASIWKLDPITSNATRIAQVNRSGYLPTGVSETLGSDPIGDWETSGIIDVSELFGKTAGSTFFTTVQAHGTTGGAITSQTLVEGGTIELLTLK